MSEIQAILIAAIAILGMVIWMQWMRSPGEEWAITEWVRRHWQCITGGRPRDSNWQWDRVYFAECRKRMYRVKQ